MQLRLVANWSTTKAKLRLQLQQQWINNSHTLPAPARTPARAAAHETRSLIQCLRRRRVVRTLRACDQDHIDVMSTTLEAHGILMRSSVAAA